MAPWVGTAVRSEAGGPEGTRRPWVQRASGSGPGSTTVPLDVRRRGSAQPATHRLALEGKANRAQGKHALREETSLRNSPKEKPVSARLCPASAQLCQPPSR